jgi:hypothetical protein
MKKLLFALIATVMIPLFISCDKEENDDDFVVVDFVPIEFLIHIVNEQGEDLLNPDTEGSIVDEDIRMIYNGKEYSLQEDSQEAATRYYLPRFYGLRVSKIEYEDSPYYNKYFLYIGEFDGAKDCENCTVKVICGDGSYDTFSYSNKMKRDKKGMLDSIRHFYHNGKLQEDCVITIVR